jgi:hypothetical protein
MTLNSSSFAERDLYPKVANWAQTRLKCFEVGIDTGVKHGRIDVVGIRDTGGVLSGRSEVVAIEVKKGTQPFATCVGQASGYSIYADRCYLAEYRPGGYTDDEISIAGRLGVGLIQISGTSRVRINEVLTAPIREPLEGLRLLVVEKLGYSLCTVCGALFNRGTKEKWSANVTRQQDVRQRHMESALAEGHGVVYWLHEAGDRATRSEASDTIFHRRYVCPDCVAGLFAFVHRLPDAHD